MKLRSGILLGAALLLGTFGLLLGIADDDDTHVTGNAGGVAVISTTDQRQPQLPATYKLSPPTGWQPAPSGLASALGLSARAGVRNMIRYDDRYDIICGEVSPEPTAEKYRRFVYVGVANSADIDDGTPEFEQRIDDVCKHQP